MMGPSDRPTARPGSQASSQEFSQVESALTEVDGYPFSPDSQKPTIPAEVRQQVLEHYGPQARSAAVVNEAATLLRPEHANVFNAMQGYKMDPTYDYDDLARPENIEFQGLEDFRNVGRHCVVHRLGSEALVSLATRAGYLTAEQAGQILVGSLGHDLNKPLEVNSKNLVIAQHPGLEGEALERVLAATVYSEGGYQANVPKRYQVDPDLLELFGGANSQTGHLANTSFIMVGENGELLPRVLRTNVGNLIINQVDAQLYSTKPRFDKESGEVIWDEPEVHVFMSGSHRMVAQKFEQSYGWMWAEGVGRDTNGQLFNAAENDEEGHVRERIDRRGEKVWVTYEDAKFVGHYSGIQAHLASVGAQFFVGMGLEIEDPKMVAAVEANQGKPADYILAQYLNERVAERLAE